MSKEKNSFIIVDGNSLINRAFYALPPLTNSLGVPIQGVYGVATMLFRAISDYRPSYMSVAFDVSRKTFRNELFVDYKATRKAMPDDLRVQMPIVKDMLRAMGIKILELEGYEADDILGTMASRATKENIFTNIVTGDRDAFQLVNNKVSVLMTKRGLSEIAAITPETLLRDYSILPHQVIEYKALCGDASDNIPGVRGIGDKTATDLIKTYGNINNLYKRIDEQKGKLKEKLESDKENAFLSKKLATIDSNVPIDCSLSDCRFRLPFSLAVKEFFIKNNFKSLINKTEFFAANEATNFIQEKKSVVNIKEVEVKSVKELESIIDNGAKFLAIDFSDKINIAFDNSTNYIINPIMNLLGDSISLEDVVAKLRSLFENAACKKVVFDAKAVKKILAQINCILVNFTDVKIAQYLADMSLPLDNTANLLQAHALDSKYKAVGLVAVSQILDEKLKEQNLVSLYNDIELPLVDVLFEAEQEGFKIEQKVLKALGDDFAVRIEKLSREIQELAGQEFNVNSPKQLGKILFEDLKLPYPKKDNKNSTAAEILEPLAENHEIVRKILDYRTIAKLNSTYVEGLLKKASSSGIIHTEFKQALTTTGRLSSVEPNLQNIPTRDEEGRNLRKAFVAKSKDRILIAADYSQIELRLLAHFSSDPIMVKAFTNKEDIHAQTAAEVFGVPIDKVTSSMRRDAKAVNFGIVYGISDFGLAKTLSIYKSKAKEYIEKYFAKFSSIKAYLDNSVSLAKSKGYAETLFGRIRKIPELTSSNPHLRGFGERVAMNMPLQGSAADIIKIAMNKIFKALKGTNAQLVLQVHDELIVECDKFDASRISKILKENMESAVKLKVPLIVDIGMGDSWYDCK